MIKNKKSDYYPLKSSSRIAISEEYNPEDGLPGNVHVIVEASTQAWTAPVESDAEAALNSLISLILMMPPDRVNFGGLK